MPSASRLALRCVLSITCAFVLSLAPAAQADMKLKDYQEWARKLAQDPNDELGKRISAYVTGIGRGVFYANVTAQALGKPALACVPGKLAMDDHHITSILDEQISRGAPNGQPFKPDVSIEMIMVFGFMQRFPCPESKN